MPCKAILHAQISAEVPMTARNTGQAIFKGSDPVPARAAAIHEKWKPGFMNASHLLAGLRIRCVSWSYY
eukprot:6194590-Pleurochrysis_carterae.AAC.1